MQNYHKLCTGYLFLFLFFSLVKQYTWNDISHRVTGIQKSQPRSCIIYTRTQSQYTCTGIDFALGIRLNRQIPGRLRRTLSCLVYVSLWVWDLVLWVSISCVWQVCFHTSTHVLRKKRILLHFLKSIIWSLSPIIILVAHHRIASCRLSIFSTYCLNSCTDVPAAFQPAVVRARTCCGEAREHWALDESESLLYNIQ